MRLLSFFLPRKVHPNLIPERDLKRMTKRKELLVAIYKAQQKQAQKDNRGSLGHLNSSLGKGPDQLHSSNPGSGASSGSGAALGLGLGLGLGVGMALHQQTHTGMEQPSVQMSDAHGYHRQTSSHHEFSRTATHSQFNASPQTHRATQSNVNMMFPPTPSASKNINQLTIQTTPSFMSASDAVHTPMTPMTSRALPPSVAAMATTPRGATSRLSGHYPQPSSGRVADLSTPMQRTSTNHGHSLSASPNTPVMTASTLPSASPPRSSTSNLLATTISEAPTSSTPQHLSQPSFSSSFQSSQSPFLHQTPQQAKRSSVVRRSNTFLDEDISESDF